MQPVNTAPHPLFCRWLCRFRQRRFPAAESECLGTSVAFAAAAVAECQYHFQPGRMTYLPLSHSVCRRYGDQSVKFNDTGRAGCR
jgi:hypothetical protein